MVNIYNTPQGCKSAGEAIKTIIQAPNIMQNRSLVLEGVSLHHTNWNNWTTNPSEGAINLAELVADQEAFYQLEPVTITHNLRGAIDLVIASSTITPYITECYTKPTLHTTSDYETIVTKIELNSALRKSNIQPGRFLLTKIDKKQFFINLVAKKNLIKTCLADAQTYVQGSKSNKVALNVCAKQLTSAIYSSLENST